MSNQNRWSWRSRTDTSPAEKHWWTKHHLRVRCRENSPVWPAADQVLVFTEENLLLSVSELCQTGEETQTSAADVLHARQSAAWLPRAPPFASKPQWPNRKWKSVSGPSWCDESWEEEQPRSGEHQDWSFCLWIHFFFILAALAFSLLAAGGERRGDNERWWWWWIDGKQTLLDFCESKFSQLQSTQQWEMRWFDECRQVKSYFSLRTPVGLDKLHRCTLDPATFVLEGQQLVIWGEMHRIHEQVGLKDKTLPLSLPWKLSCVAGAIIKASHPVSRAHLSVIMSNPQIFHPWHLFAPCWQVAV